MMRNAKKTHLFPKPLQIHLLAEDGRFPSRSLQNQMPTSKEKEQY